MSDYIGLTREQIAVIADSYKRKYLMALNNAMSYFFGGLVLGVLSTASALLFVLWMVVND